MATSTTCSSSARASCACTSCRPCSNAACANAGTSLRAFGFGLSGLRGGEFDYYLSRVLELPLPRLKWVLWRRLPLTNCARSRRATGTSGGSIQWHAPGAVHVHAARDHGRRRHPRRAPGVRLTSRALTPCSTSATSAKASRRCANGSWLGETARTTRRLVPPAPPVRTQAGEVDPQVHAPRARAQKQSQTPGQAAQERPEVSTARTT